MGIFVLDYEVVAIDLIESRGTIHLEKISFGALAWGLLPFIGMCFSVSLWDRVTPSIAGLPFNLFWLALWVLLSSGCLWMANRLQTKCADRQSSIDKKDPSSK